MQLLETLWDSGLDGTLPIMVLGVEYTPEAKSGAKSEAIAAVGGDFKLKTMFTHRVELPAGVQDDVRARIWITYRTGFPVIPRDPDGPSPLTFGALMRGTLDLANASRGFTSDAGWGCMIRTSQSLMANALLTLRLGRDWRYNPERARAQGEAHELEGDPHWEVVRLFTDSRASPLSLCNFVDFAHTYCGKRVGEWFGPSDAAKSIRGLVNATPKVGLHVYVTSDSGDIYEEELDFSSPTLILGGLRLGINSVNPVYWEFLKLVLSMEQSVGIAGGRPGSSHYFFGYQGNRLLYLDPHHPQRALGENASHEEITAYLDTVHTTKIKTIHLNQLDPSMLVGFLVKTKQDYNKFKQTLDSFSPSGRFFTISPSRPAEDEFLDQVKSINDDWEPNDPCEADDSMVVVMDADHEETPHLLTAADNIDDPVTVPFETREDPNANEMACDDALEVDDIVITHDRKYSDSVLITPNSDA